jgi:hypothetical protein
MIRKSTDELAAASPPAGASLSDVQEWMSELIRHERGLAKSETMREAAARHFSGNERLSPAQQIDIYRTQFWLRHTNILIEDFPGVTSLLGQEIWEKVAESYLTQRGYDIPTLRDLGQRIPEHLEGLDNLFNKRLLLDMARLECAYVDAFDVPDDPVLSSAKVAQIPAEKWANAVLHLSHSIRLLRVNYAVADLRRTLRADAKSVDKLAIEPNPQNLVIYRRDRGLFDKAVSLPAFLLLEKLREGVPLVPACERVVALEPTAAEVFDEQLMEWFALWGRLGWIVDVEVPSGPHAT